MSKRSKILIRKSEEEELDRTERFLSWIGRRLGRTIEKTESKQPSFAFDYEPKIRKPDYDYTSLFEVATTSWPLRRAFRAIIQESTRKETNWVEDIHPRFKFKCVKKGCESEFLVTPKDEKGKDLSKCLECDSKLRGPDIKQKKKFRDLLKNPNRDYGFRSFVRSSMFWDLSLDDVYWSIAFKKGPKTTSGGKVILVDKKIVKVKEPSEIYVEDSRFMFPVADMYGHLGGYEWYCDRCYGKGDFENQDLPVIEILPNMLPAQQKALMKCQYCNGPMTQTAYVEEVNGAVLARWGKDEIVHGSSSSVKPSLFGNPKIISIWKVIQTLLAMDDYNYEVYSEGKVGNLVMFPGEDDIQISEKKRLIEEEKNRLQGEDITTGRYRRSKKVSNFFIGVKEGEKPSILRIMNDLKAMQSLEFYEKYEQAIAEVLGVTPEFAATSEPGKGSTLKIEVQDRTTEEQQANFSDPFNNDLIIRFGITDWILKFKEVEKRDILRDAQVLHTKVATLLGAARVDLDAVIDEKHELTITGRAKLVEGEKERSRMGERPRNMGGKPERQEDGEATRVQGERFELRKEDKIPLPISWYSATQIKLWDRVYAVNNDRDEVFIVINEKEVEGTRTQATNINYIVASLLDEVVSYINEKAELIIPKTEIVQGLRREFDLDPLIELANYLDSKNKSKIAQKIDSLRMRLDKIKPPALEIQARPKVEQETEMLHSIPEAELLEGPVDLSRLSKALRTRAPYGVTHEEETLAKKLDKVREWAKKQIKSGKKKQSVINKALVKGKTIIEDSYRELEEMALRHTKTKFGKETVISPEELKRNEVYKSNTLQDFEKILRDDLRRKRGKKNA